jgi:hypothetical protein
MQVWTEVDRCKSPMIRALAAWWTSNRGASGLPDRRDFDPAAFKALMPNLVIAEVEPEPFRIRYRLVGTRVAQFTGFDFTGRYLDELIALGSTSAWQNQYAAAFASRQPLYGSIAEPTTSGGTFTFEFGLFPVTLGGEAVEQFIALEDYFGASITSAQVQVGPSFDVG